MEKYADTLKAMFNPAEPEDKGVLLDKLIYMAKKNTGEVVHGNDEYYVPEGFDYVAFMYDYKTLLATEEVAE